MIILFTMYWLGSYDDADHHQTGILIIIIQWRWPWSPGPNDVHRQSFHDHSITHWSSSQSDADNSSYIISRTREDMLDPDDHPSMLIIIQDPLDPGRRGAAEGAAANTGNLLQKILIVAISLVIIIIIVDHHSYPIVVAKTRNHHHHCCIIIIHTSALFQRHEGEILNWGFEANLFIEPVQRFFNCQYIQCLTNCIFYSILDVLGLHWTKERSWRLIEKNVEPGCFWCFFLCQKVDFS